MPWHIESDHPGCKGWAVVKDGDGSLVGCHLSKAKALAHLAALNINVKEDDMETETERQVDNTPWDSDAAMAACKSAADFRAICAGRRAGDPALRKTWALPHHKRPGAAPNAAGVRAALGGHGIDATEGLINKEEARRHLQSHMRVISAEASAWPPRDDIVRAMPGGFELRQAADGGMPTLVGHMAVFDEWAEIHSIFEGHFMERIARGSFVKTFAERGDRIRILFQHGRDPMIGDKPLGPPNDLHEDDVGAWYEAPLLDTSYNRDLVPGLEAGVYGSSFRFRVTREEIIKKPEKSDYNPDGIPERTIREVEVYEGGPVTFPAYPGTDAGVRSLTDYIIFGDPATRGGGAEYAEDDLRSDMPETPPDPDAGAATTSPPVGDAGAATTSATGRRPLVASARQDDNTSREVSQKMSNAIDQYATIEELAARRVEAKSEVATLDAENAGREFMPADQDRWDALNAEIDAIDKRVAHLQARMERITELADKPEHVVKPFSVPKKPENIWDTAAVRTAARTPEDEARMLRDNAMRALDIVTFAHERANKEDCQARVAWLLKTVEPESGKLARYILTTGDPAYERAFGKALMGRSVSQQERELLDRALSLTAGSGGYAIPFVLDPTVLPTSNLSVNPYRAISRVEAVVVDDWKGVSSAGITAAFAAEATQASDDAPTLVQPVVSTEKAQVFIPYSIEVGMDWGALSAEMARLIQDAKDDLEASKYTTGTGTNEPFGVITGATTTVTAGGTGAFAAADVFKLEEGIPPRFRPRAAMVANRYIANKVRQFDTAGGATLWIDNMQLGLPNQVPTPGGLGARLLGYPAYEASAMAAVLTTGSKILIGGDFSRFLIADRVGLTVEYIPHLFGANQRPTGQRGLYGYWRTGSKVLDANAFRVLVTG